MRYLNSLSCLLHKYRMSLLKAVKLEPQSSLFLLVTIIPIYYLVIAVSSVSLRKHKRRQGQSSQSLGKKVFLFFSFDSQLIFSYANVLHIAI